MARLGGGSLSGSATFKEAGNVPLIPLGALSY